MKRENANKRKSCWRIVKSILSSKLEKGDLECSTWRAKTFSVNKWSQSIVFEDHSFSFPILSFESRFFLQDTILPRTLSFCKENDLEDQPIFNWEFFHRKNPGPKIHHKKIRWRVSKEKKDRFWRLSNEGTELFWSKFPISSVYKDKSCPLPYSLLSPL